MQTSVVLVGKSLEITMPLESATHLNLTKDDKVYLYVDNGHVIVEEKE